MYLHVKVILLTFVLVIVGGVLYLFRGDIPKIPMFNRDQEIAKTPPGAVVKNDSTKENTLTASDKKSSAKQPVDESTRLFNEKLNLAKNLFQKEEFIKAKKIAENIMVDPNLLKLSENWIRGAEALSQINTKILFTDIPCSEKAVYTVIPGDSLDKIAKRFKTSIALIQKSNNLDETNPMIYPDQVFRIYQANWNIKVIKSQFLMLVYDKDTLFKIYHVGIGKQDRTPVGTFVVSLKDHEPEWYHDGIVVPFGNPDNVLGTRWLALKPTQGTDNRLKGYGIHGTWEPETIGTASSLGCVRMINEQVEELFDYIAVGTQVVIED